VLGAALGVLLAFAAGRYVEGLLFETSPHDPLVFGGAVVVILLVAAAASLIPATRATRVDPVVALRNE
jgi:ABC-type lipoprotein release transport system permease subunit